MVTLTNLNNKVNRSMAVNGHASYFEVPECGLYRRNGSKPDGYDLSETFDAILQWTGGKSSWTSTLPWAKDTNSNTPSAYCYDLVKDEPTGDFFMVMWKSDEDANGKLYAAPIDKSRGAPAAVEQGGSKGTVLGRPCYYWIIPQYNSVVSLKFDHSMTDSSLFMKFVRACINNHIGHDRKRKTVDEENGSVKIYFEDDQGRHLNYRFRKKLYMPSSNTLEIRAMANKITHVVKRQTISVERKDHRSEWVKMFDEMFSDVSVKKGKKNREIEVLIEASPTETEIASIFRQYSKDDRDPRQWDNTGFILEGKMNQPVWATKYRLTESLSIPKSPGVTLSANDLKQHLLGERQRHLLILKRGLKDQNTSSQSS